MAKPQKQAARLTVVPPHYEPDQPGSIFRVVHCADHHFTGPWPCECKPGSQSRAIESPADEIGTGGSRGGAKSEILLAFLAFKGNPQRVRELLQRGKEPSGADIMYIAHRNYRGLVLREQANDLGDLMDRAEEMWGPTGCTISRGNPSVATWRTGAKITFGHFGDNGWKKYIGPQYQRIGIDQAEMMASKEIHDRIIGSCRSKWRDLTPQVMMTFNPGGGDELAGAPGQAWLMDYFCIEHYEREKAKRGGDYIRMLRDEHGKIREFIPSKVSDNPYLKYKVERDENNHLLCQACKQVIPVPATERRKLSEFAPEVLKKAGFDPDFPAPDLAVCPFCAEPILRAGDYYKWLNSIEPLSLRAAWRDGDWHALSGIYFRDFRPNGPLTGEPANAKHVYKPEEVRLEPWTHAWGSVDWGYIHPTVFQQHRKSAWGQVYTEKEIVLNRVEPFELGVLLARELKPVLAGLPSHHMNIFLSPDAYAKRESENTVASQIVSGISKELGPRSAFLADLTDEEREMDSERALESLKNRRREQADTQITLLRANNDRVAGWMHMQTMLRFRSLSKTARPDMEFANKLHEEKGLVAYMDYMNQPEFKEADEVLPKWQISSECKNLIACLPRLMHKPGTNDIEKTDATETRGGDDPADCARYGLFSEERQGAALAPLEQRIEQKVKDLVGIYTGLSQHSIIQATNNIRYHETHPLPKKGQSLIGHNRIAVRRALFADRSGRERLPI
jgi:hypothetical protein